MFWMIAALAGIGLPAAGIESEASGTQPTETRSTEVRTLPTGWRWVFEPIALSEHWVGSGFTRLYDGGVVMLDPGPDTTIVARHVYHAGGPTRGAAKPEYEIVVHDNDGRRLDAQGWGMSAGRGFASYRTTYKIGSGIDHAATIGLAVLDLEGRQVRSAAATGQAGAAGAEALPLPVLGELYEFDLPTIGAGRVRSEDLRGKVVLIDCWATWCGPCMEKMPKLRAAEEALRDEGLVVIGINFDADLDQARKAIDDQDLTWAQVHAPSVAEGYDGDLWNDMTGIDALPRLLLIDRDGVLVDDFYPFDVEKTLREAVDEEGDG